MKVFGKWLIIQHCNTSGKKSIISWSNTKKGCKELLRQNKIFPVGVNTYQGKDEDSYKFTYWIEKNTKEYKF